MSDNICMCEYVCVRVIGEPESAEKNLVGRHSSAFDFPLVLATITKFAAIKPTITCNFWKQSNWIKNLAHTRDIF